MLFEVWLRYRARPLARRPVSVRPVSIRPVSVGLFCSLVIPAWKRDIFMKFVSINIGLFSIINNSGIDADINFFQEH